MREREREREREGGGEESNLDSVFCLSLLSRRSAPSSW